MGGGAVLELNPANLQTLRTVATAAAPRKLAVSADGSRLYVGLDDGVLAEYRTGDLSLARSTTLPTNDSGGALDRIFSLAADPFNTDRVLLVAGSSQVLGATGLVFTYQAGTLAVEERIVCDFERINGDGLAGHGSKAGAGCRSI